VSDLTPEGLDAMVRSWAVSLLELADRLEAAALIWKNPDAPDAFGIPHAAVVMDLATELRKIASRALADFPE
jgi:hypothetical protein